LVEKPGQKIRKKKKRQKLRRSLLLHLDPQLFVFFFFPSTVSLVAHFIHLLSPLIFLPFAFTFLINSYKMSAVQPVAVYALRVPPGALIPAVPNAAASVSSSPHEGRNASN